MFNWQHEPESFESGRQGTIYKCWSPQYDDGKKKYVMKKFKKNKSNTTFIKEVDMQRCAAEVGVAPPIIDFYIGGTDKTKGDHSYIVMEKLDQTIFNIIRSQGKLTDDQWKELIKLYEKLDSINVIHNDANPMNVMMKFGPTPRFLLLDYGMSKRGHGNMHISYPLLRARLLREEERISSSSR